MVEEVKPTIVIELDFTDISNIIEGLDSLVDHQAGLESNTKVAELRHRLIFLRDDKKQQIKLGYPNIEGIPSTPNFLID